MTVWWKGYLRARWRSQHAVHWAVASRAWFSVSRHVSIPVQDITSRRDLRAKRICLSPHATVDGFDSHDALVSPSSLLCCLAAVVSTVFIPTPLLVFLSRICVLDASSLLSDSIPLVSIICLSIVWTVSSALPFQNQTRYSVSLALSTGFPLLRPTARLMFLDLYIWHVPTRFWNFLSLSLFHPPSLIRLEHSCNNGL
ncbi:hypothetical protein FKP32DRAFT_972534 [Trametes sanguinea]|nr:hypothetical protein FKP32DRAFT_972534 [Trametes sanguinea]